MANLLYNSTGLDQDTVAGTNSHPHHNSHRATTATGFAKSSTQEQLIIPLTSFNSKHAFYKPAPFSIRTPLLPPTPIPTTTAIGVANLNTQEQLIIPQTNEIRLDTCLIRQRRS